MRLRLTLIRPQTEKTDTPSLEEVTRDFKVILPDSQLRDSDSSEEQLTLTYIALKLTQEVIKRFAVDDAKAVVELTRPAWQRAAKRIKAPANAEGPHVAAGLGLDNAQKKELEKLSRAMRS